MATPYYCACKADVAVHACSSLLKHCFQKTQYAAQDDAQMLTTPCKHVATLANIPVMPSLL